eukprot:scaffold14471_cov113-Isochrysis_galbana.AAC.13
MPRHERAHRIVEPGAVVSGNKAVAEDAHGFMHPQSCQVRRGSGCFRIGGQQALHHGGQVAQVKGIVRFGGRRQHFPQQYAIQVNRCVDERCATTEQLLREVSHGKRAQDNAEDLSHGCVV